ncbi:MAG TPA: 3-hydroxyacyl-CoA dehydrogenase NAD-binding domain-containing protein [Pseudonocardiaceae bacterium]|nr:3-hydroxyacyl-CoA dehydrogenase NAD-binding domain-containing protein [Pseudonocardiaceae bacterium]
MRTVGVVGAGAIGSSWAALLLRRGLRVVATDPAPNAETALRAAVAAVLGDQPELDRLRFVAEPAVAVSDVDLVLECGPERVHTKREIFAALDAATDPDVLLASSSSGIRPSEFQDVCAHPERVLVAHPFYPPHLLPLVEVVGGRQTSEEAIETALAVLRSWGKTPIRLRAELPGHVANRLQAALWREAYDLVRRGVVSVADLDVAISAGPGLRWALLGPLATQHLSGGPGGMAHMLAHLGPPMVEWWHDLGAPPELTPELVAQLVDGVAAEFGGREADIAAARDRALEELLALKRTAGLDER